MYADLSDKKSERPADTETHLENEKNLQNEILEIKLDSNIVVEPAAKIIDISEF